MDELALRPIGWVESPFLEKFGIPRQPGLIEKKSSAGHGSCLRFFPRYRASLEGLEIATHVWVIFGFHHAYAQALDRQRTSVRVPRLGGIKRMGALATRTPHRPNPIGLSVVRIDRIELDHRLGPTLWISLPDIVHGSPIFDLKPYLPEVDRVANAKFSDPAFAPVRGVPVKLSSDLRASSGATEHRALLLFLKRLLSLNPHPRSQPHKKIFRMALQWAGQVIDVEWEFSGQAVEVQAIETKSARRTET